MERKIFRKLLEWKDDSSKKALLLIGARQIGKTYILKKFAKSKYKSFVYFNLEDDRNLHELFESEDISADKLLDTLSFLSDNKLVPGKSVIILDEIQACIPAYSSLKALAEDGRYDIIASGSLLGVHIDDLQRQSPMGYVNFYQMHPMDFEEFLWALGLSHEQTDYVRGCINNRTPIDNIILNRLRDLFRRYLVIGGMPAAVKAYVENKDYSSVREKLDDILRIIREDAERYSKSTDRLKISACLDSIPSQLASKTKKFKYSLVEKKKNVGSRTYRSALLWLERSGLVNYCYNVSELVMPLKERVRYDVFKPYLFDTGILIRMMEPGVASEIISRDVYSNNGAIVENCIACAIRNLGHPLLYYKRDDSTMELDFIYSDDGVVTALEVKSGRDRRSKSLRNICTVEKRIPVGMKLAEWNIGVDVNGIIQYPLFAPFFFDPVESDDPMAGDDFSDLIDEFDRVLVKQ